VKRIGAEWLLTVMALQLMLKPWEREHLPPDDAFEEQRREVATPGGATPSNALLHKLPVILERGRKFCPFGELDCDLPSVVDQESRHKVVIVCGNQG